MKFIQASSPHASGALPTHKLMLHVIMAAIPAACVLTWYFGWGVLINLSWAIGVALVAEAVMLKVRDKPVWLYLKDGSAVVTAVTLSLAIPPTAPWWLTMTGILSAIILAKHLYGGLGMNPFNPAMVGYVIMLVSFPLEMSAWVAPGDAPSLTQSLERFLGLLPNIDALTGATPLDTFRNLAGDIQAQSAAPMLQGVLAGPGWQLVNVAFLFGGLYMLQQRIINWQVPMGLIAALTLTALPFWLWDNSRFASPLFHLFSGATMMGAFFIASDPVTAATSRLGKVIYGAMIGVLVWVIRSLGGYPDGMAFAVLLLNLAAPTIDYYTQPRTYGHQRANRGTG